MNGVCGAIAAGSDPDGECPDQGAASCGTNGVCDGTGACQKYASGTVCLAASCLDATTVSLSKTCNGSGTCSGGTLSCAPYRCSGGTCTATCGTSDANCAPTGYCDGVGAGSCKPKIANGDWSCLLNHECQSNICATNGVCCVNSCATAPPCGNDGKCLPYSGACAKAEPGRHCGDGSCGGTGSKTLTGLKQCNGLGVCQTIPTLTCLSGCGTWGCGDGIVCGPYQYSASESYECNCDPGCSPGDCCEWCTSNSCYSFVAIGDFCLYNGDCLSGICLPNGTCQ